MSIELKIKSKHLSKESKIIRFEERKLKAKARWLRLRQKDASPESSTLTRLHLHRTNNVRNENRATFLARAFIEGKSYFEVESKRSPSKEYTFRYVVLPRVLAMVKKYHNRDATIEEIVEWTKP